MKTSIYMNFPGNAKEALALYQKAFQIHDLRVMHYKDMPNYQGTKEQGELILHSMFSFAETIFHASDNPAHMKYESGNNITIQLMCENEEEVNHLFSELQEGADVLASPGPTFFAKRYAMFRDRFGISWQLLFEK